MRLAAQSNSLVHEFGFEVGLGATKYDFNLYNLSKYSFIAPTFKASLDYSINILPAHSSIGFGGGGFLLNKNHYSHHGTTKVTGFGYLVQAKYKFIVTKFLDLRVGVDLVKLVEYNSSLLLATNTGFFYRF